MEDNPHSKFVVLDYGDKELSDILKPFKHHHRLSIYRYEADQFHMAHAKNMAPRLAIKDGADVVVTLDADNFTHKGFEDYIQLAIGKGVFLCPFIVGHGGDSIRIAPRGVAGRLVIRAQEFIKIGGYDEQYDTWRGEDVDIVARLQRVGFDAESIPKQYLDAIKHMSGLRFKEYPHAAKYETDEEVRAIKLKTNTVVNYGNFGCGEAIRSDGKKVQLDPLPTRIFGIGMQRTGTTSLAHAFRILGFDTFHFESGDKARDIWDEMTTFGSSRTLERYYALCDMPIPMLYKQLDKAYPNSKFILTIRDEDSWIKSMEWLFSDKNPDRWTWDKWPISHRMHQALYGTRHFNEKIMRKIYRRHNDEVIEYFKDRPNDLLVLWKHSWDLLCPFLGQPVPKKPYPWKNPSR